VDEIREHLCVEVANQMTLFKDGILFIENGRRWQLHDHIIAFNQLICQLLNDDNKIEDEEQALPLLASLPKSYKPTVQTMLVGKTTLKLDEVTMVLWENERMLRNEYF